MSKKLTQEEFEKKFYNIYQDKFIIKGNYINALTPVDICCNSCGYVFAQTPNHYDKKHTQCPICNQNGNTNLVIIGVNDMWTTYPEIAQWLSDPQDGYKYRFFTDKELKFKCPYCGKTKICMPRNLINGFVCNYCSDSISYPNKLMANILDIINIPFETEYIIRGYNYRFDFYFKLNNTKYLIEMDGGMGHGNVDTPNYSIQDQIRIDNEKNEIAKENGYCLIRINCNYDSVENRKDYIYKNILNSPLSKILKISYEQLDLADMRSQMSQLNKFAILWKNGVRSYDDLIKKINNVNHRSSIRYYARKCSELGLINETYIEFLSIIRKASNRKIAYTKGQPVMCKQTSQVYYSIAEAQRVNKITNLSAHLSGKKQYCGMLSDGTKLTWVKISNEEYLQHIS